MSFEDWRLADVRAENKIHPVVPPPPTDEAMVASGAGTEFQGKRVTITDLDTATSKAVTKNNLYAK